MLLRHGGKHHVAIHTHLQGILDLPQYLVDSHPESSRQTHHRQPIIRLRQQKNRLYEVTGSELRLPHEITDGGGGAVAAGAR